MGKITAEETFSDLIHKTEVERIEKEQRLTLLEQAEKEITAKEADIGRWMQLIREKAAVEDVDRELLESLVEKIVIGKIGGADGNSTQDIRIYYNFVGLLYMGSQTKRVLKNVWTSAL